MLGRAWTPIRKVETHVRGSAGDRVSIWACGASDWSVVVVCDREACVEVCGCDDLAGDEDERRPKSRMHSASKTGSSAASFSRSRRVNTRYSLFVVSERTATG